VARLGKGDDGKGDRRKGGRKGLRGSGSDVVGLVVAYLKQETLGPVKGLARFVLFGMAGSLAIAIGSVTLLVAVLRLLQTETGAFHGNLSWIPYFIVLALATAVIGLSIWRVTAGPARRRLPTSDGEPR
jgi:predicted cobalt transporter CbtA